MSHFSSVLTPAYGRDYKSKKEVEKDLHADKDFIANSFADSTYINKSQIVKEGYKTVTVRYANLRKVTIVELS